MEAQLEELIAADTTILGNDLLIIGRQVPTAHGKFIDLLGLDADGNIHVLELKRDRTPRDVVAQALDYGSWVETLSHQDVRDIYEEYRPGSTAFETAFSEQFGHSAPDELNADHSLTIVASDLDPATARIIGYLNGFDVPLNVLFFQYFSDGDRQYLARTWLVDEQRRTTDRTRGHSRKTRETWNGQDWYVACGEDSKKRSWADQRQFGFVSAGGGKWHSGTLRNLPLGGRVFVHVPGSGYVGVGVVTGRRMRFDEATLDVDGVETPMAQLPLTGTYMHENDKEDNDEYVVPVEWLVALGRNDAFWETGLFASQHSACKLSSSFTVEALSKRFGLDELDDAV